ncbi:unnamed protein product [Amoebophrya sp. A120]|nr:unnamed protein product [Amoebophrya sp. A120]|eukprot:GSA120T00020880001.1
MSNDDSACDQSESAVAIATPITTTTTTTPLVPQQLHLLIEGQHTLAPSFAADAGRSCVVGEQEGQTCAREEQEGHQLQSRGADFSSVEYDKNDPKQDIRSRLHGGLEEVDAATTQAAHDCATGREGGTRCITTAPAERTAESYDSLKQRLAQAEKQLQFLRKEKERMGKNALIEAKEVATPLEDDTFFQGYGPQRSCLLHDVVPSPSSAPLFRAGRGNDDGCGLVERKSRIGKKLFQGGPPRLQSSSGGSSASSSYSRPPPLFRQSDYLQATKVDVQRRVKAEVNQFMVDALFDLYENFYGGSPSDKKQEMKQEHGSSAGSTLSTCRSRSSTASSRVVVAQEEKSLLVPARAGRRSFDDATEPLKTCSSSDAAEPDVDQAFLHQSTIQEENYYPCGRSQQEDHHKRNKKSIVLLIDSPQFLSAQAVLKKFNCGGRRNTNSNSYNGSSDTSCESTAAQCDNDTTGTRTSSSRNSMLHHLLPPLHPGQIHIPQYDQRDYLKMIHNAETIAVSAMCNVRCQRMDHWLIANRTVGYDCVLFFADMESSLLGHKEKRLCPGKDISRYFRYGYPARLSILAVTFDPRDGTKSGEVAEFVAEEGWLCDYEVETLKEFNYGMGCVVFRVMKKMKGGEQR